MNKNKLSLEKLILVVVVFLLLATVLAVTAYLIEGKKQLSKPAVPPSSIQDLNITTDKEQYAQGETVKLIVRNNSNNQLKYFENISCGLEVFADNEWRLVHDKYSCNWGQELLLSANEKINDVSIYPFESGKYRLALFYKPEKILKLEAIGNVICEDITGDLENLLIKEKWVKNDIEPKDMCDACGCSATNKNSFSVSDSSIDITDFSCYGTIYTINYKSQKFKCTSENYKNYAEQAYPPNNWEKAYSNEFTVKEKTAMDPRCGQKVKATGNCEAARLGFEFDPSAGMCVRRAVSGCSFEVPFNTLGECQKTCQSGTAFGSEMKFETIIRGIYINHPEKKNYVIKDEESWKSLEAKLYPRQKGWSVYDFTKYMIIAVFQGEHSTGSYSIEITKVTENTDNIEVFVRETEPGPRCVVTEAFTRPYHIVKLERSNKEAVFNVEKEITQCK